MKARELAFLVLRDIADKQAYANLALAKALRQNALNDADRRLVTELVYGTLKQQARLDYILSRFAKKPLRKMHPALLIILRLGLYQILELSRIPESAACNESVKLAKKFAYAGGAPLVNGMLRSIIRQREHLPAPTSQDPVEYLAVTYSHPSWLIARWLKRYGFTETEQLCQANNETPPLSLRTNTLKITRPELARLLEQEGVTSEPALSSVEGLLCSSLPAMDKLQTLAQGLCQVQDESSMLVAPLLGPRPNEKVLDICAAPGGKTTHLAQLMENKGQILAFDLHPHKVELIRENASRLGISIIKAQVQDSLHLPEDLVQSCDRVLADVPCSGLGVLRRKPDARWNKQEQDLKSLPQLQYDLLVQASRCVKPGGILVYSTCTIEPEENQAVVERFLKEYQDFAAVPLTTSTDLPPFLQPFGSYTSLQILPHKHHMDGFFLAKLQRKP